MKKLVSILLGLLLGSTLAFATPGPGRKSGFPGGGRSPQQSNAPGTADRDFGRDRAMDVGQGKKEGLKKEKKHHQKHKKQNKNKDDKKHDKKKRLEFKKAIR